MRSRILLVVGIAGAAGLLAGSLTTSATASVPLRTAAAPGPAAGQDPTAPPGSNDWSCKPDVRHPQPVILVNGTFESMTKNWPTMSPFLADHGYCVFAFNYGNFATGPVADSAVELKSFVTKVLRRTGADQVDLVGHSQGGMMPRYYLKFLGGAGKVDDLVGIAPSNHGTQGLIVAPPSGAPQPSSPPSSPACQACIDQQAGSPFMRKLNRDGDLVPGPDYTVISTTHDEVVTPYTSQALAGPARRVTNVVIQDKCPTDTIEHDQTPNDPVVQAMVLNALQTDGPMDKSFQPSCAPWA